MSRPFGGILRAPADVLWVGIGRRMTYPRKGMRRSAAWGRDLSQMNGRRRSAARREGGVEVIHRLPRKGRRKLAMFAGLATIVSFLVLSPVVANADAGNPIL